MVLPQPDGPISATASPALTSQDMFSKRDDARGRCLIDFGDVSQAAPTRLQFVCQPSFPYLPSSNLRAFSLISRHPTRSDLTA